MADRVLLLATKDTVAYRRRPGHESVATGAELLAAAGPVAAGVTAVDVISEPGWDLSPTTLLALARRVREAAASGEYGGIVLTQGVDAMAETAYLIDLVLGADAARTAIVLTGAVRALDDPDSDGPANLAGALAAASDPAVRGLGAVACAHGELHAARWVTLVDASRPDGFGSAPYGPVGRVVDGRVRLLAAPPPRPPAVHGPPEWDVVLLKTYPGINPELLASLADGGARGVVLEGTGRGNVPASLFAAIGELLDGDVPVVIASRSHHPPEDGLPADQAMAERLGAIGARGLRPEQARVALMAALGNGGDQGVDAVRDWFARL
ncbi:asparaginase [Catellatospora bangladeshensis]|uniref:L-asparaginase n=1 Tax=Catellatospora bangladeshensis TaxID=310355 RepID=A0A8J3JHA0_9ACTN|nr:asparaginase domain-containing protein [Catellatospora bangladeshensis]GIF84857.1 L-asparaginase [Catellatospora bangladeshensis]